MREHLSVEQFSGGADRRRVVDLHVARVVLPDLDFDVEEPGGMFDPHDVVVVGPAESLRHRAGIRAAVPTVMAPRTPMEVWQRKGMNVRVLTAPSSLGGDTSVIFGTVCVDDVAQAHQFPGLQPDVLEPVGEIGVGFQCFGALVPVTPRSAASRITTGMPLSMQVTSTPSTVSTT